MSSAVVHSSHSGMASVGELQQPRAAPAASAQEADVGENASETRSGPFRLDFSKTRPYSLKERIEFSTSNQRRNIQW